MIYFNTNKDIFEVPEIDSTELFSPKYSDNVGLTFQLHTELKDSEYRSISSIQAIRHDENETIDFTIADFKVYYVTIDGQRYVNIVAIEIDTSELKCDFYFLKIQILYETDTGLKVKTFYSNYFTRTNNTTTNNLTISSTTDFDNKFYNGTYYENLMFLNDAISVQSKYEETLKETGEIKQEIEKILYAETYTIVFFVDRFGFKFLNKIKLFDTITFNYLENVNVEVLNIDYSESYDAQTLLHRVELTFDVNQIIRNCSVDYQPQLLPSEVKSSAMDDAGTLIEYMDDAFTKKEVHNEIL